MKEKKETGYYITKSGFKYTMNPKIDKDLTLSFHSIVELYFPDDYDALKSLTIDNNPDLTVIRLPINSNITSITCDHHQSIVNFNEVFSKNNKNITVTFNE